MKNIIAHFSLRRRFVGVIFLVYAVSNSLFITGNIGLISIAVMVFYFLIKLRNKDSQRESFILSLVLLALAVILQLLDTTNTFNVPIRKLSEWTYLLMLVAVFQLLIVSGLSKKRKLSWV